MLEVFSAAVATEQSGLGPVMGTVREKRQMSIRVFFSFIGGENQEVFAISLSGSCVE